VGKKVISEAEFLALEFEEMTINDLFIESTLKYDTDWNWLMPVLRNCLNGEAEHNDKIAKETINVMYECLCDQNISGVYNACVEFIKWYNLNNK